METTQVPVVTVAPKYVIEKNIPMPARKTGPKAKREELYPFRKMQVGDSFRFTKANQVRVSVACTYWGKKLAMHFAIRRDGESGDYRVWRVRKNAK